MDSTPICVNGRKDRTGGENSATLIKETIEEISRIAVEVDAVRGHHVVPPKPQRALDKIQEGYTFLAYSEDFLFLNETCREGLAAIKWALPGSEEER